MSRLMRQLEAEARESRLPPETPEQEEERLLISGKALPEAGHDAIGEWMDLIRG